jgi:hypothetical protein
MPKIRRTLKYDMAQMNGKLTLKQSADVQEKHNGLYHRIRQWREAQLAYLPLVVSLLRSVPDPLILLDTESNSESCHGVVGSCWLAEDTPLYLPLSVPMPLRDTMKDVAAKELRLCKAQAEEALEDIRRGRRMITGLSQFKKLNICGAGNKPNTHMRALYDRLQQSIRQAANRYRAAWEALYQLEPDGRSWRNRYCRLDPTKDIHGPGKQLDDPVQMQNGQFEQSWIWMVVGNSSGKDTSEEEFDETMCAEWAKMKARCD